MLSFKKGQMAGSKTAMDDGIRIYKYHFFLKSTKTMLNLDTTDADSTDQIYSKPYSIVNRPKSQMAPWHHGTIALH